jgi:hypothetical protein
MAFTLVQAGSKLKSVNTDGGISAALTLPTGVTLATNRQPRFARFNRYVVVVNTPTRPISVDTAGIVRVLTPAPPSTAVVLSAGASGSLSGTYLALQTYKILDAFGNTIAESDYGPAMTTAFTISSKKLHAVFPLSSDTVSATQLYRTATNGGDYFSWVQIAGNVTTSEEDDIADAALGIADAPSLGTAPDLTLIAEFGGRLWGVDRNVIDELRYTEAGTMYGWSALNTVKIPHVGADDAGITALIPRRAALGVARRDVFNQVTGSQRSNITPVIVNGGEGVGCVSQESVLVYNDIAYFLARDGVYQWDSNGISPLSDGLVRTWFTTDDTFNRSMFWRAFAEMDPTGKHYRLFLASKGSDKIDRWIELDMLTGAWFGPHFTTAFDPTSAFWVAGRNQQPFIMLGSREGYLSQDQSARNDWDVMPIDAHAAVRGEEMGEPEQEKYWGELAIHTQVQGAGATLTITPELGDVDETTPTTPMTADLTKARQRVGRIGSGNSMVMDFTNNQINVDTAIYGYEINPVHPIGQR